MKEKYKDNWPFFEKLLGYLEHQHYYSKKELLERMKTLHCSVLRYQKFQFGWNALIVGKKE